MVALLLPMGNLSSDLTVGGHTTRQSSSGFGDPMIEFDINLIGPKAIENIPDLMRYEPGFSLDILVDLAFPIGVYDDDQAVNLGQNRWYGRIGRADCLAARTLGPGTPHDVGILAGGMAVWR